MKVIHKDASQKYGFTYIFPHILRSQFSQPSLSYPHNVEYVASYSEATKLANNNKYITSSTYVKCMKLCKKCILGVYTPSLTDTYWWKLYHTICFTLTNSYMPNYIWRTVLHIYKYIRNDSRVSGTCLNMGSPNLWM